MLAGRGGTNTIPFTQPQRKKLHRERSGDRGGMEPTLRVQSHRRRSF